jgi:trans-2,3-dihydro-3-hydroxyanthranilate isomerase
MAVSLGLAAGDLGADHLATEIWSAGNPFTFVPVRDLDAIGRCRVNLGRVRRDVRQDRPRRRFVFCRETTSPRHAFHARMFAPSFGILEDPRHRGRSRSVRRISTPRTAGLRRTAATSSRLEQGYEMGRPSVLGTDDRN